ncbi:MAG: DUF5680 domain-containing protein [Desulfitobacteriaceae bacterium]
MVGNIDEFKNFLIKAKRTTYAGDGALEECSRPNSKDLHFREGEFLYIDTYLGDLDFIGEEVVWLNGVAIWGMNYYGRMLVDRITDGFGYCLKGALKAVKYEAPYRGPGFYRCEGYEYYCNWTGDITKFKGTEEITMDGTKIYELVFNGGALR